MQTLAFVTDKFYFEFVINSEEDLARITKRAFKGVRFNDQSTVTTVASARKYYATLLTNWSVQAGPEVQTLRQLLPQSRGIYHIKHLMHPDNLEECLKYVVECAGNFKQHAQSKGHPVTFEQAIAIAVGSPIAII